MASFEYTAKDHFGNELTGLYQDVDSVQTLRGELLKVGYVMVRARRRKEASASARRIRLDDVVAFTYKFASMFGAGLSVTRCLETLGEQTDRPALRRILGDIRQRIEAGSSLAKAFDPYRAIFTELFVGMVEAGETAGKLAEALSLSAAYLEKKAMLRSKVRAAFVYPIMVGTVCVAVTLCLLLFVIPIFSKLYSHMHVQLPLPTLILVTISHVLRQWSWLVLAVGAVLIWAGRRLLGHSRVRSALERIGRRLPMFGHLQCLITVSHFIRPFSLLISVGVSILDAVRIAAQITRSEDMMRISDEMQKSIQAGNTFARTLADHPIFPSEIVQMAGSGEQVGKLAEMLGKAVDIIDRDIDRRLDALVIKLEPVLTLVIGLIVGSLLIGIYLPMIDYMSHLK
jgi:type IV pilus assembly protein PilC